MAAVVVTLPSLILDFGLGSALVQRRPLTERHVRVGVTLGMGLGALLAAALVLAAPVAGELLHADRLPAVLKAQAALFVLVGIGVVPRALLQRKLAFRQLALVEFAGYIAGGAGIAIVLALRGFGVWSLVIGALLQSALVNLALYGMVRPAARPLLARREASDLLGFGTLGALNGAVGQLAFYGDNLVVGRMLGASMLGLYGRAFSLMMLPLGYLGTTLFSVLFSTLSEIHDDRARFARVYTQSIVFASLVTAPVMAGMAVAAPEIVATLYGPQWRGAVVPLQIFCAVGIFRVLALPAGAVTHASGNVGTELRRQIVYAVWVLLGAGLGTRWGIAGAATGVATAILYKYVAMAVMTIRICGMTVREYIWAQGPGLAVATVVGMAALATRLACRLAGFGSGATLGAMFAACVLATAWGLYLLPRSLRPTQLFQRLTRAALPWPAPLRLPLGWVLRADG